jgi:hypothetical protein
MVETVFHGRLPLVKRSKLPANFQEEEKYALWPVRKYCRAGFSD